MALLVAVLVEPDVYKRQHQPHGVGNHACIITEPNDELMGGVRKLLEDLHFVGYSNFDVKYDERDGSFKFFDFNTDVYKRQADI